MTTLNPLNSPLVCLHVQIRIMRTKKFADMFCVTFLEISGNALSIKSNHGFGRGHVTVAGWTRLFLCIALNRWHQSQHRSSNRSILLLNVMCDGELGLPHSYSTWNRKYRFVMENNYLINLFPGLRIYMCIFSYLSADIFYFPYVQPCECPSSPHHPQLLPVNLFIQGILPLVTICYACCLSSVHFS